MIDKRDSREPKSTAKGISAIAILAAILLHLLIGVFFFVNFQSNQDDNVAKDAEEIDTIIANTVSADELRNQKKRVLQASKEREQKEKARKAAVEREIKKEELRKKMEERRVEQAKKDALKKVEAQKQAKLKKIEDKKKAEQAKRNKIKQQKAEAKAIALKKIRDKERIEKALKEEKIAEQREAEKRKKQKLIEKELERDREQEAIEAQRQAERKRKAAELAKQLEGDEQAELDAVRDAAHQKMLQEMAAEDEFASEQKIAKQHEAERNTASLYSKYVELIASKVFANFQPPPGTPLNMSALVKIKLDRNGNLLEGRIVRSSGNKAFDRSCEAAIQKAAPFPMPRDDEAANKKLRNIEFEMKYSGPGN